jgi:hypothetical protein
MLGAPLSEVWGDNFVVKKKKKSKKFKSPPLEPSEMGSELLVNEEQKDNFLTNEYSRERSLRKSIEPNDNFYSFNKNVVTRNEPYDQRPRVIEEDPEYQEFIEFKRMKREGKKENLPELTKVKQIIINPDQQFNELLLYIFTGFFLLVIYDNMYQFGKKSY